MNNNSLSVILFIMILSATVIGVASLGYSKAQETMKGMQNYQKSLENKYGTK